jgi:HEAT repeat protein
VDELQQQAARVRALADRAPSPGAWAELRAALASKFEGTQSLALGVLGRWGGPDAVAELRAFLLAAYARPYAWAVRGVAVRELARTVGAADAGWALDLYFGRADWLEQHELLRLVLALPPEAARARLVAELGSPDARCRWGAAKAVGNLPFPDRAALLAPLRADPDRRVRASAETFTGHAPARGGA